MTALISIWRQHANGMEFGEFLIHVVEHGIAACPAVDSWEFAVYNRLQGASHSDLLEWARERFGIEA